MELKPNTRVEGPALVLVVVCALASVCTLRVRPAAAQSSVESNLARGTQFVFVVDDSKSMREAWGGHPAADPDRLAIFAIHSILSMLDDSDEVSIVRLNGIDEGEPPPPIEPLAENREGLRQLASLGSPLALYGGSSTPCRSALDATKRLLNAAHRQNVAQVVMFLTDGECTGRGQEPEAQAFLHGLRSHDEGLFRFYLLRFEGRPYTRELEELARRTDAQAIRVGGDSPTAILEPFADALTRSQGYEAELLTPDQTRLAAHRGARRVRLLAVAPGDGPPLQLRIADLHGRSPDLFGRTRNDVHRYPGGRTYRYAAIDYQPNESPMTIQVEGAGDRWKVVAVPEYRLRVQLDLRRGTCEAAGSPLLHGVETGGSVCAVVRLVNERGRPVAREGMGGDLRASVLYGTDVGSLRELPATPTGELAEYTFERHRVERGDHLFQPVVTLRLPGREEPVTLRGPQHLIQASSVRVAAEPGSIDFGRLRPGEDSEPRSVSLEGNFTTTPARLEVGSRDGLPSCVTFTLSGQPEGTAQPITAGQAYTLVARVAPYCGPEVIRDRFDPLLRIAFDGGEAGYLPAAEIGTSLNLDYLIEAPSSLDLSATAGESSTSPLTLDGNQTRAFDMDLILEDPAGIAGWPDDDLRLGFATGESGLMQGEDGPLLDRAVRFDPTSPESPIALRAVSDRCCPGGTYEARLALLPPSEIPYSGEPPPALMIPLRVRLEGAGFWACRGNAIVWGLLLLLLLLLLLYVISMFRHSSFLDRDRLAGRLVPLRWDGYGGTTTDDRSQGEVRDMVHRSLSWRDRLLAWLKANPLRFGLPGGRYRETAELWLQPERLVDRSSVRVVPERDLDVQVDKEPRQWSGRLFVSAIGRSGLDFFGVPREGRFGRLKPERMAYVSGGGGEPGDEEPDVKPIHLRSRETLTVPVPPQDREAGAPAGWQVG